MKAHLAKSFFFLLLLTIGACQNTPASEQNATADNIPADSTTTAESSSPASGQELSLTAKFVRFSLGDASHFIFEDKTGMTWDFAGSEDQGYVFEAELPEAEADESNQGWGSNPALQGKWFDLRYEYRMEPLYPDGPIDSVMYILEAKMKE